MAIRSGFFNSVNGDRKYDAKRFAEYFAAFIGNGVFPNPSTNLQAMTNDDMTITIKPGKAWINGYILINDDDYIIGIEPADGVLNRIDRVVARYDVVDREIRIGVKKGTFASDPIAQELQRDADAYELCIADVKVSAGAIKVTQADVTDLRLNKELCGIVHGIVEQVDTTTLFNQYVGWYQNTTGQAEIDITIMKQQFEQDFNTWFETVQNTLGEDAAGNLLILINGTRDDLESHKAENVQQFENLENTLNNIRTNDIQTRREVLDIKLKLDEMKIVDYLNKTGIGFYDLFTSTENIDTANTTATVDTSKADVTFEGQQLLKMAQQNFDSIFNDLELSIYDKEREDVTVDNTVSNTNQIQITISPGSVVAGDSFYYNGEVYTVMEVNG